MKKYLLLLLTLTACGRQLDSGKVIDKYYEPAQEVMYMIPMTMSCGNNCYTTVMIPQWYYDDEDFVLVIEGHDEDQELMQESWYVLKMYYDEMKIGDHIIYNEHQNKISRVDEDQEIDK